VTNDRPGGVGSNADALAVSPAIQLVDIVKRFPGVVANDGVNLTVRRGTIHALIGENGAGKSTVMKILYGAQRPDEGHIIVNGTETHFKSPKDAIALGIGMVFQHFMLADNLTVWENVVLGAEPGKSWRMDEDAARTRIAELSKANGLGVNPEAFVGDLGVGERQRVEILKVLYRGAQIIILDEPTAVLVPQEVDELFQSLRELTAQGVTIVFISHKLDEVLAIADDITVIRAGKTVAAGVRPAEVTARDLAELMVGSELPSPETRTSTVTDVVALELDGVTLAGGDDAAKKPAQTAADVGAVSSGRLALDHITLKVHKGQIVGIAGVEGNGQTELLETIIGTRTPTSGRILLAGDDLSDDNTRVRRERGMAYIPEDRQRDGLILSSPLWENVMLGYQSLPPFSKGPWMDKAAGRARADAVVKNFDVRTPGIDTMALALSGGNQQKFIVGREMLSNPSVLVAAHPTRGIDVGAQAAVWDAIRDARETGLAVLLVSADLDELIGLSDTLLVMLRGRIVARLNPATVTKSELGQYMTGAKIAEEAA
jgi:general nucleoside transport system ATP-binding protein